MPTTVTASEIRSESTSPAEAKASVLAARKRIQSGAASNGLVIDRHDRLGGKQLDPESSDGGDGHDQLGTPAPPVQGGTLYHRQRESQGGERPRPRTRVVHLPDNEHEEYGHGPRERAVGEAGKGRARLQAHAEIVSHYRWTRIGLRDELASLRPGSAHRLLT